MSDGPRGDILAAPDMPPYPREWDMNQRTTAYWTMIQLHGQPPTHTSGWYAMLAQAARQGQHVKDVLSQTALDLDDDVAEPDVPRDPSGTD